MRTTTRPTILVVEDNPGDLILIQKAFDSLPVRCHVSVVENGGQAMAYLRREGDYAGATRPNLVLLDLNVCRKDGREVLAEMKGHPVLCTIPVVVFTTSNLRSDIDYCYQLGANAFVTKPSELQEFTESIRSLADFWLRRASVPTVT